MGTLQHDNTSAANGDQVTAIFDAGREYQRRVGLGAEVLAIYRQLDEGRRLLLTDEAQRLLAAKAATP